MFYTLTIKDEDYKLKLTTSSMIELEKKLGCNPLMIFGKDGGSIPEVGTMVDIFACSLQAYNHGISHKDAMRLFDDWLDDENTITDFIKVIFEIYKASGIIKNTGEEKN